MDCKINFEQIRVSFGNAAVLRDINLTVCRNSITGFMGPSGSGKSTLISLVNRMIDFEDGATFEGRVSIDGSNVLDPRTDVISLRKRVGTVFAVPLPLPRSIFENIAYGLRLQGMNKRTRLNEMVAESLSKAFLFAEVRDRLHTSALKLSGGQQQRLCLARTLAVKPEIILLDEPCSGLDPISTAKIEEALKGPLWRLKDLSHFIFRRPDSKPLMYEALLDCTLSAIFHECMKIREEAYQLGHPLELNQGRQGPLLPEVRLAIEEWEQRMAQIRISSRQGLDNVQRLFQVAWKGLRWTLVSYREMGLLMRYLAENRHRVIQILGEEEWSELMKELHPLGEADTWYLAAMSYLEGGWKDKGLEAPGRCAASPRPTFSRGWRRPSRQLTVSMARTASTNCGCAAKCR